MVDRDLVLLWICNTAVEADRAIRAGIDWIFVDIESLGKDARQPATSFISDHKLEDIQIIKRALPSANVLLRINPVFEGTQAEVQRAIELGVDALMLPMFSSIEELRYVEELIDGRVQFWPLIETVEACDLISKAEVRSLRIDRLHFGLNDLHLALDYNFIFSPLLDPIMIDALSSVRSSGIPFGLGGVSKLDQGALLGSDVLHLNFLLGSNAVILSQEFRRNSESASLSSSVTALRDYWSNLSEFGQIDINPRLIDIYEKIRNIELSMV